jgi:hypothetical protein
MSNEIAEEKNSRHVDFFQQTKRKRTQKYTAQVAIFLYCVGWMYTRQTT